MGVKSIDDVTTACLTDATCYSDFGRDISDIIISSDSLEPPIESFLLFKRGDSSRGGIAYNIGKWMWQSTPRGKLKRPKLTGCEQRAADHIQDRIRVSIGKRPRKRRRAASHGSGSTREDRSVVPVGAESQANTMPDVQAEQAEPADATEPENKAEAEASAEAKEELEAKPVNDEGCEAVAQPDIDAKVDE